MIMEYTDMKMAFLEIMRTRLRKLKLCRKGCKFLHLVVSSNKIT